MDVQAAIRLLLDHMNTRKQFVAGTFGAFDGSAGNMYMQQRELNAAIMKWQDQGDAIGLKEVTAMMHIYGNLTDDEYEKIMETLEG